MSENLTTSQHASKSKYSVVNNETGEKVFGVPSLDLAGRVRAPRQLKVSTHFCKTNMQNIKLLDLCPSTLEFLIYEIFAQMNNDNAVCGPKMKGFPKNYKEVALAFEMKTSTVSNHMKILVERDVIRMYRNVYYTNPNYSFRFSMKKIPEHIVEAFPDLIWEGAPTVI